MNPTLRIARKEFAAFFSSPIAFIFLGTFLAVTLFVFFWVDKFFARNIADVRPLFEWMPLLLIFLVAAITMRMWSEERRAGTLEFLLTAPVNSVQLVLGKFLACLALVAVALLLTLPLPITVSMIGPLDWGPVIGGYVAALFLAAAYAAIGLFVSARSSNQIVSLIMTALICGFFYLLGSTALTGMFGNQVSEFLKLLGSGSRFESITRGVIDMRDLYYYLSLMGVFLTLNVFVLEWLRWAGNTGNRQHRRWGMVTGLFALNFIAANLWLAPVSWARADITHGHIYSISDATKNYLAQLREPLLIRGYFSAKTHPLLAPLVPQLRDLLEEYAVAGKGKVRVEFIDPREHPELEKEANQKYNIRPVPFQFASKYQSSVVNSYFNILVKYGDQYQTLGFRDLIDVKSQGQNHLQVDLRDPEYDITQAIKKVLYGYQGTGNLFDNIAKPVNFTGYISATGKLPAVLQKARKDLDGVLQDLSTQSGGKFSTRFQDPDAGNGDLAKKLESKFGFRPMATSLFDNNHFWFYMTLQSGHRIIPVPLPDKLNKTQLSHSIDAALKRFSRGFQKTIALDAPAASPQMARFGMGGGERYGILRKGLSDEYNMIPTNLKNGQVPDEADLLMLVSPESLNQKQLFAVDQFLMRGGTVVMATSPYKIATHGALSASKEDTGLSKWLAHNGISLKQKLVLDPQNSAFPIPVNRNLGGFTVRETRLVEYPYFSDIRNAGMNRDSGLTNGLDQITMSWPSPIDVDKQQNKARKVIPLLHSSDQSWTSDSLQVQPDFARYGKLGFPTSDKRGSQLLGVAVQGRFDSFFKDKPSPLAANRKTATDKTTAPAKTVKDKHKPDTTITHLIDRSPESARIILFSSSTFLSDNMMALASEAMGTRYTRPIQLMKNAVDWSLADRGLLSIRGRSEFSRTLDPLNQNARLFWEYLNYGLALLGLFVVWLIRTRVNAHANNRYAAILGAAV